MKQKIILIVFLFFNVIFSNVNNEFLDWQKKFNEYQSFKFEYSEETAYQYLSEKSYSKGEFFFQKPNNYKVINENVEIIGNQEYVWNYDPLNQQTIIQKRENVSHPLELLILNDQLFDYFEVTQAGKIEIDKQKRKQFVLTKNESVDFNFVTIKITLDKKEKYPELIEFIDENQTVSSISIHSFDDDVDFKDEDFLYKRKIGVEEIKMY